MHDNGADFVCAENEDLLFEKADFSQLVSHYSSHIKAIAGKYTNKSGYFEDLVQEGLLGLYKAVLSYDSGRGVPFSAFVLLCVKRQIINAARQYQRYSTDIVTEPGELSSSEDPKSNPVDILLSKEAFTLTVEHLEKILSHYEFEVFMGFLKGQTNAEIALGLNKSVKSVSNALARGRQKLAKSSIAF